MNRVILLLTIITLIPLNVLCGNTASLTFSVTIPKRLELPEKTSIIQEEADTPKPAILSTEKTTDTNQIIKMEETTRDGQLILLKTIVEK